MFRASVDGSAHIGSDPKSTKAAAPSWLPLTSAFSRLCSMPTVLRTLGFRFFFFSGEGSEPPHIHVEHGDKVAKSG